MSQDEAELNLDDLEIPPPWPNVGVMLGDYGRVLLHYRWHDAILAHLFNDGIISAGEVFRLTSHACWGAHNVIEQWRHEIRLNYQSEFITIRDLDLFDFTKLMMNFHGWLTDPGRILPIRGTVGTLLDDRYQEYLEDSEAWLERALGLEPDDLPGEGIMVVSILGVAGVPSSWWGSPAWPEIVDSFVEQLDDPTHWRWEDIEKSLDDLPPEPKRVKNRRRFHKQLLNTPWTIDTPTADWIIYAGLEFLFFLPQPTEEELAAMELELSERGDEEQPD